MRFEHLRQRALEGGTIGELLPRYDRSVETQFPRNGETAGVVTIRDDDADLRIDTLVATCTRDGLHVRAAPRDEHAEPQGPVYVMPIGAHSCQTRQVCRQIDGTLIR